MTPWRAKMEEQGLFGDGGEAKVMDLGTDGELVETIDLNDNDKKAGKARLQFGTPKHEGGAHYL